MLMVEGNIVYHGRASKSVQYFSALGYQCPLYSNPGDYFIKILNVARIDPKYQERIEFFVESYNRGNYPHVLYEIQS